MDKNCFTVFTKPWKNITLEELGALVKDMGFDGVEYPLREGYQVQPSEGVKGVKRLVDVLGSFGLTVGSIAGGLDVKFTSDNKVAGVNEGLFAACGEAGVAVIRICQGLDRGIEFFENLAQIRRTYDAVVPYCEKYGVTVGVQIHCDACITSSAETALLLKDYDPRHIAAVWDSGHSGLTGVVPSFAIDTVWDRLCMVNFKAAYWKAKTGPEAAEAQWESYWTTGPNACGSWRAAVNYLKKRGYSGFVCMPAEYSDEANVERYTRSDFAYLKGLFAE